MLVPSIDVGEELSTVERCDWLKVVDKQPQTDQGSLEKQRG